ncbi:MAG TPA: serine/threonine-protein kinase [Pyrinomonadaceae bacterium]|nr:serine/threonine-protein kinase [Pyrinomonadaceae bacterium]
MIGQIVGNYKIEQKLGEGGMGAVYRGIDMMIEREVAIKVLRAELASQPQVVERFRSEAVTLAKLNHPNIATLYSFMRQGENFFMVLEFVRGATLDQVIQQRGALPVEQAVPLFCQVLDGIQHAHEYGIIHRDIKPANMMLTERGNLKVLDFGIARILGTARMTRQGNVIGTIEYMSPEQVKGLETDARSDIYSLGMLLYEMLTGRIPFDITNEFELMKAQIEQMPVAPRAINPAIPEVVEQAIGRAITKDPARRFQSAGEFRAFLLSAGFAATGRLDPVTHGDASPYATRPISHPSLSNPGASTPSNPPLGYATIPSQPGLPPQPPVPATPSQPGLHSAPTLLNEQGAGAEVDPMAQTLIDAPAPPRPAPPAAEPVPKETRLGAPGSFAPAAAPAARPGEQMKETRIGVSPLAGAAAAQTPQAFSPTPAPAQPSFFSRLTWLHYAGAAAAAVVLVAVLVGGGAYVLFSGAKKAPDAPPARALTDEPAKPAAQEPAPAPQAQPSAPATAGGALDTPAAPAPSQAAPAYPPAQAEKPAELKPVETTPPATAANPPRQSGSAPRPAAPRPAPTQRPKPPAADDAAARRRRALDALDQ